MKLINTWPGWECVRPLGSGAFGKVYEIQKEESGKVYKAALKVISIPQDESDIENAYSEGMSEAEITNYYRSFVDKITNEFALMSDLKGYTNIVSYEDHMLVEREESIGWDILIRMELLTPLHKWVANHPMDEKEIIRLGCDICRAIDLCHKNKIIHRDIKPENIFVNKNGDFKLGDFGIARVIEKTSNIMSERTGTETYMAPEVFKGQYYNHTADIYSLGVVLYRFLNNNRTPFLPQGTLLPDDRINARDRRMSGEKIPAPINGSEKLKKAVLMSLEYNWEKRLQTAQAFQKVLEQCSVDANQWIPSEKPEVPQTPESVIPSTEEPEDDPTYRRKSSLDKPTVRAKGVVTTLPKKKRKWVLPAGIGAVIVLVIFIVIGAGGSDPDATSQISPGKPTDEVQEQTATESNLKEESDDSFSWKQKDDETEETNQGNFEITGDLKLGCSTNLLLVGDSVRLAVGTDSFVFDNSTEELLFYSSNTNVATVDSQGVILAKSAGVVNFTAVYKDKEAIRQLHIVEEQPAGRDVIIDTEYERISVDYYEDVTVDLTLYGDVPENFGIACYCSGNMQMNFEFGTLSDNVLPLTICALNGDENEGKVTVLLYPKDNPQQVVSSTSFTVKVD